MTLACLALILAQNAAPLVEASLLSERQSFAPGRPTTVGVVLRMAPEWHVYWTNPGDSGVPTQVEWKLPKGWRAGPLRWPTPHRFDTEGSANFGYPDEVILLADLTPPATARGGAVVRAEVTWLACKEACVAGSAQLSLYLPISKEAPRPFVQVSRRFDATRALHPQAPAGWAFEAAMRPHGWTLAAVPPPGFVPGPPTFFASEPGVVEPSAPQPATWQDGRLRLDLPRAVFADKPPKSLRGVLSFPDRSVAYAIDVPIPR